MPSTLVSKPTSLLTGTHQLVAPLPVNGATYIEPIVKGAAGYGWLAGDANAPGSLTDVITLPDVGVNRAVPAVVGETKLAYTGTPGTSWAVPVPTTVGGDTSASRVKAGDLAVVDCISQESVDVAAPGTPATWQTRGSWGSATGFVPRVTRFFKVMAGGETGTLVTVGTASARFHFSVRIIRGVDITSYFAAAAAANLSGQAGSVDPPSLTTTADGALVEAFVAANVFPNGADDYVASMGPTGYDLAQNYLPDERGAASHTKIRATAGAENPAALGRTFDNWTVVVDAYKPATNASLTLLVATLVSDTTATTVPSVAPTLAHNEKQTITSVLGAGTFTLSYGGDTTAAINWNDSAATIQTRLRALASIGATGCNVTGGPLPTNPVVVEFVGPLANQDLAMITASSGSVTITESQKGHPAVTFTWEGSVNCPRWSDPGWPTASAPQINFWTATPGAYVAGTKLSVSPSNNATGNQTVSALVLVIDKALTTNPISDTFGTSVGLLAKTAATYGSITPAIPGSKILAVLGISNPSGNYSSSPGTGVPNRFTRVTKIESDRSVMDIAISAPAPAAADTPNGVQWTGSNDFVTGLMAIQPAGTAGTMTLPQVLNDGSQTTWADIANALGSMYEVVELDVSGIPSNAIVTSASIEIQHSANAKSYLRAVLVGIEAGGTVHPCAELRANGYPTDANGAITTISTGSWVETADGTPLDDFPRFGIALFSTTLNPTVTNHRIYAATATFEYEPGGPIVSGVVGPATAGDSIVWDYTSDAGLAQTHVQVRIRAGTSQLEGVVADAFPADPLAPVWGDIVYDSGKLPGSLRRSLVVSDVPLVRGPCTVSVRAWTRLPSGREVVSPWATANFDISGVPAWPVWTVSNGRLYRPGGAEMRSPGFNGGVTMGVGGWGDGEADKTKAVAWAWDRYPGDPTYQVISDIWGPDSEMTYQFPGGTVTAGRHWSQTLSTYVDLPDRVHAMTGVRSAAAIAKGIPEPDDCWRTGLYRIAALPRPIGIPGDGTTPSTWNGADYMTPARTIPQYVAQVQALLDRGLVVAIQDHSLTGTNVVPPAAFVSAPTTISPDDAAFGAAAVEPYTRNTPATRPTAVQRLRDTLKLYDALAAAYTDGGKNVWIGLPNEFYTEGRTTNSDNLIVSLVRRIRAKGFNGIISIPTGRWAGDLAGLARGDYDSLMTTLEGHGVGWSLIWEWHNYGENWPTSTNVPYTHADVVAQLTACRDGVPGSGRKYVVWMAECGAPVPAGTGLPNAKLATEIMFTDKYGPAAALLFPGISSCWWGTGDDAFVERYSTTKGAANKVDENAALPSSTGPTQGTRPWWRMTSSAAIAEWGTEAGRAFWDATHKLAHATSPALNLATGGVEVEVSVPSGMTRAWLERSTDRGVSWDLAEPFAVTPGVRMLVDYSAPLARRWIRYRVSYDAGPMTETTEPVAIGPGDADTLISDWYLMAPGAPELNQVIDVADFGMTRPRTSYVADNPERTVVVSSAELGARFSLGLRTVNPTQREKLLALLGSGEELRLVSILGESWWVKLVGDVKETMLRGARPLAVEVTKHRSAHRYDLTLVQTRRS